jgi:hypothetical protein
MSQQNIYPCQLLNDLHNYFPELLYNPVRFRSVPDVLLYIRQVAQTSPYAVALQQYSMQQQSQQQQPQQSQHHQQQSRMGFRQDQGVNRRTTQQSVSYSVQPSTQFLTAFLGEPSSPVRLTSNANNVLLNTLISGLFGDVLLGNDMQQFLDQRVLVSPTAEEIDSATNVFTPNTQQPDLCTICQDEIEANQQVRRINHCTHYFHKNCIDTWLTTSVHCPTCRHDIRESDSTNSPPPVPENHRRTNIRSSNTTNQNVEI